MTANDWPGHVTSDAELIRYLDGELGDDERARLEASIAGDASIAGRLAILRRRGERVRALLAETDPTDTATAAASPLARRRDPARWADGPGATVHSIEVARSMRPHRVAPPRARSGWWLRAAAVVLVLLGAGLLVPPVRAWIIERLEILVPGGDTEAETSPDAPSADERPATAYVFPVTGSTIDVAVDVRQAAGRITVIGSGSDSASIEPETGGGTIAVLPGNRVRIQNDPGSTASYTLGVPVTVTTVRVRIGEGEARMFEIDARGGPLTILLTGGGV